MKLNKKTIKIMLGPHKLVNGIPVPLTKEDVLERQEMDIKCERDRKKYANAKIDREISALEIKSVGILREALITGDHSKLVDLDNKIKSLQSKKQGEA